MADGKMFGAWLAGDLLGVVEKRAEYVAGGNQSKYIRALIERDLASNPETLLVGLAQDYHPAVVDKVRELFAARPANQKLVVARFLDALMHAAEGNKEFDPTKPFELIDAKKANEYYALGEDRMEQIAHRVMELQAEYGTGAKRGAAVAPKKDKKKARPGSIEEKLNEMSRKAARVL